MPDHDPPRSELSKFTIGSKATESIAELDRFENLVRRYEGLHQGKDIRNVMQREVQRGRLSSVLCPLHFFEILNNTMFNEGVKTICNNFVASQEKLLKLLPYYDQDDWKKQVLTIIA